MGKMKHVMIDIETMGPAPDGAVIAIGLAEFDPKSNQIGKTLEVRCTFDAMRQINRKFDPDTVEWWMQQSKEAQDQLFLEPRHTQAHTMCQDVHAFLYDVHHNHSKIGLWAKGPNFDLTICRDLFDSASVAWPYSYGKEYCVRTMLMIAKANGWTDILEMENKLKHGALSDAIHQAKQVMEVMGRVKQ